MPGNATGFKCEIRNEGNGKNESNVLPKTQITGLLWCISAGSGTQWPVPSVQCGENYGPGQESCRVQPSQELRVHSNILEHIVRGKTVLQ